MQKKFVLGLTSLVVASAVTIGGTLAFMTANSGPMTNTFKTNADYKISGEVREPAWDGYQFGQTMTTKDNKQVEPDGLTAKPGLDSYTVNGLGITQASKMTPGLNIPKNPSLKNTTPKASAYMAIKVTYQDANGKSDRSKFDTIASLVENAGWVKANKNDYKQFTDANSDIYFYTGTTNVGWFYPVIVTNPTLKEVPANGETTTLFDKVTIYGDTNKANQQVTFDLLDQNQFKIVVTGGAVQTTDLGANADATAKTQLVNLLK